MRGTPALLVVLAAAVTWSSLAQAEGRPRYRPMPPRTAETAPPVPGALRFMTARDLARFERIWSYAHGIQLLPTEDPAAERAAELQRILAERLPPAARTDAVSANVRVSSPVGDPRADQTQDETAAASAMSGNRLIAAWNDSKGFNMAFTLAGYGYSTDGGATWIDGGSFPRNGLVGEQLWGDPALCMDRHGHAWYTGIYESTTAPETYGVNSTRGSFAGATLVWQPPIGVELSTADFLDKPGIACDPELEYVYIIYTRYPPLVNEGRMEIVRSLDGGVTWDPEVVLQPIVTGIWARGAQVVVDDEGGVNAFWYDGALSPLGAGQPYLLKHRRSTDHGATFGPTHLIAEGHANWYSGPPGFNRLDEYQMCPSAAADVSSGAHRGALYFAWEESAEPSFSGVAGTTAEVEPNTTPAQANPITLPRRLTGTIASGADHDFFRFDGVAGQMVALTLTHSESFKPRLQLGNAPAADTFLVHSVTSNSGGITHGWMTLPSTGSYTIGLRPLTGTGSYSLDVENVTAVPGYPGRDHRDLAVAVSHDHGDTWSTPILLNDDPPLFDQAQPMLAVDSLGLAHAFWYDRRNDTLRGGRADIYYARSEDGGATWSPNVRITDNATTWQVPSHGSPNFGDYSTATASGNAVFPVWTDGRFGSPDVMTSRVRSGFGIACAGDTTVIPGDTLRAHFTISNLAPFTETFRYVIADSLERFAAAEDTVAIDAGGQAVVFYERPVTQGPAEDDPLTIRGTFRSAAHAEGACRSVVHLGPPVSVGEPGAATRFDLAAANPMAGEVRLSFRLARDGVARIDAFDVSGRRVARIVDGVHGAGSHTLAWDGRAVDGARITAGAYFLRAWLDGRSFTRRIVYLGP